jgi:hypothetical protein
MLNVLATSLHNHLYGLMQFRKTRKTRMLHKIKEEKLILFVMKIQVIRHPLTLTQPRLKVVQRLHKKETRCFNMGFQDGGGLGGLKGVILTYH